MTYVQLGHLGADVGLPDLAHHARLRGIHAIRGRDDESSRSVREQFEREAGEKVEARPVAISREALAELHLALDGPGEPSGRSDSDLARELVPNLESVRVKRRPIAADIPPRESVLGALGNASNPPRSADAAARDLRMLARPSPAHATTVTGPKVGRNDPCPCGSGRKWKKCCAASAGA